MAEKYSALERQVQGIVREANQEIQGKGNKYDPGDLVFIPLLAGLRERLVGMLPFITPSEST